MGGARGGGRRRSRWVGAWALAMLALPCAGAEYWQVRQGDVTVIAVSDRALAVLTAQRVWQMRRALRWAVGWPGDYQPPPALVFALTGDLAERTFERQDLPVTAWAGPTHVAAPMLTTAQLAVLAFPLRPERRRELDALQYLYATSLLRGAPTASWPECPALGLAMLFAGAEFNGEDHLYLPASKVPARRLMLPGLSFLDGAFDAADQRNRDEYGYSCFVLSDMLAAADAPSRAAFAALFSRLGQGVPLTDAVPDDLGGSAQRLEERFHSQVARHQVRARDLDLHLALPVLALPPAEVVPIEPSRLQALLKQLCTKLANCRGAAAAP